MVAIGGICLQLGLFCVVAELDELQLWFITMPIWHCHFVGVCKMVDLGLYIYVTKLIFVRLIDTEQVLKGNSVMVILGSPMVTFPFEFIYPL